MTARDDLDSSLGRAGRQCSMLVDLQENDDTDHELVQKAINN